MSVIKQIQNEIQMGLDFIKPKREIWRERLVKYVDQNIDDEKVGVNTIYAMMNLSQAIKYSDETSVTFLPRKFGDEEYADNLTSLAEFDYDLTERKKLKYQIGWDTDFYGIALERNTGRDEIKQVSSTVIEDPLTRICDPYSDHLTSPRYHYFEKEMLKSQMTEDRGFDQEAVSQLTQGGIEEIETNKSYKNDASGYNDVVEDISEDFYVSVYDGVRYEGEDLYTITVDSKMQNILRKEKVELVTEEEKKSGKADIRTQVCITRYSPKRNDPIGISLIDVIQDKQKANSILMNLRLIDAKFNTFGQMNLVNTDIVKNTTDLLSPTTETKWIGVNAGNQSLSNAVYPVPRTSIMADSYNVSNELSNQLQLETGMSENTLGVPEKGLTLGQAQQVQANANIRLALGIAISNWGEEDYWKYIYLRGYEEYYEPNETKFVRVANGFDSMPIEFRRDDFLGIESPEVKIESKKSAEQQREKEKMAFLANMPYFIQDPTKPKVVKNLALRYAMRLQGTPREYIKLLTYDKDEESAKRKLIAINNDDPTGAIVDNMGEDHQTFLVIFEGAKDGPVKDKAIQARKDAYAMSGQMMSQQVAGLEGQGGGQINAMQNQMTSNLISDASNQNNKNIGNIAQNA